MIFFDCHCHLSFLNLDEASIKIKAAPENMKFIMGGYQPSEWENQVALKNLFPDRIKTCFGLHPWYIKSDEFDLARDFGDLKVWMDQADFIGEVGLDFFGDDSVLRKDTQINLFEQQLALQSSKPFVFHIVQGHGKALEILKDFSVKGFVHSFSGSTEVAHQYFSQGILLSFGPNILNENYKKAREVVTQLPPEALLIESDSPSHVLDESDPLDNYNLVLGEVANLRGISPEELQSQVTANMEKLLQF